MFSLLKMENGNILGKGTCSRDAYSVAVNSDGKIVYTDRILLENEDKDTKEIFVHPSQCYIRTEENKILVI